MKEIEKVTNHDVKAVEYFLKEHLASLPETACLKEFVHFCCTSEDINNLSYASMIKDSMRVVICPKVDKLLTVLAGLAQQSASVPLLALTHGQAATPTTFGREVAVFVHRVKVQFLKLKCVDFCGKFNGATGSFNAHIVAYPEVEWEAVSRDFVENSLGLTYQPVSTQIESHDYISELSDSLSRISSILIGLCRDMWSYTSRGVLKLRVVAGEVGSSTMPHKVNPIDFENAEGNLGLAISLFDHFSSKLVISRLQRDLSDSTVLRTIGVAFSHFLIALDSLEKGLSKVDVNLDLCEAELNANWSILAEPVQTVMRKHGIAEPYERLKAFTRGRPEVDKSAMRSFIESISGEVPEPDFTVLKNLTPSTYIGLALDITQKYGQYP